MNFLNKLKEFASIVPKVMKTQVSGFVRYNQYINIFYYNLFIIWSVKNSKIAIFSIYHVKAIYTPYLYICIYWYPQKYWTESSNLLNTLKKWFIYITVRHNMESKLISPFFPYCSKVHSSKKILLNSPRLDPILI